MDNKFQYQDISLAHGERVFEVTYADGRKECVKFYSHIGGYILYGLKKIPGVVNIDLVIHQEFRMGQYSADGSTFVEGVVGTAHDFALEVSKDG